jgi:SWI/SNF-related matrix-associated actin-dependent regulator 1 of chromatin subfamily A
MKITFWKGVFVADASPSEHGKLKRAGFEPHEPTLCEDASRCKACRAKIGRRYWSNRVEAATRLRSFCTEKALQVMKDHLRKLASSRSVSSDIQVPAPPGLQYLPYQKAGIAYTSQHRDTLVGDEPGLGKTIISLGFINLLRPRQVLVIAPATLAYNWKVEAEKWLVDPFNIFIPTTGEEAIPELPPGERVLVITNYEKVVAGSKTIKCPQCSPDPTAYPEKTCPKCKGTGRYKQLDYKSPLLKSLERVWDISIYDEAQALKNPGSKRSQAVLGQYGLFQRSKRTVSLSGTPIENYPKEIWALAATICPAKFGDWSAFSKRYCGLHLEPRNGERVLIDTGHSNLAELQQKLRSTFMIRRLKKDVLKELPPKRRQLVILGDQEIDWSKHPEFRRWKELYEKDYEAALARVEAAKTQEEYRRAIKSLQSFVGIAFQEMADYRHKTAVLKLPMCLKYIDDLLANGLDNVVIFAHHKDVLQKVYVHYKSDAVLLYGETPMAERGKIVSEFQNGPKRVFIGGLKAAGTGITLTKASTVVFIEIDWVPATLSQAEDRLCRYGQTKMVHVIHLVLNNTLDVNMSQKVIKKQDVIDKALDQLPEQTRMKQILLPLGPQS